MSRRMTKPNKWHVRPAKTQISLGICPVWSQSLLSTWRNIGPLTTYWANSEDPDQTGQMPWLIWVFAGRTFHFVGFVVWWLKLQKLNSLTLKRWVVVQWNPQKDMHATKTQVSRHISVVYASLSAWSPTIVAYILELGIKGGIKGISILRKKIYECKGLGQVYVSLSDF